MKKITIILFLTLLSTSCDFFENKEKRAIETCQKARIQTDGINVFELLGFTMVGLSANPTWLDYANFLAIQDPNSKLDWSANKTKEKGVYLVSFSDESGWGHKWEVTLEQQVVRHINANEYLSRKYGLSRLDKDGKFQITDISINNLKIDKKNNRYSKNKSRDVVYIMQGSVINNTDKNLTSAEISGKLQVVFKDKSLESSNDWNSGFKRKVTKSKPWKPQEKLDFYIKAKDIEEIYLQYDPEYVFFNVNITAEDPIGFSYNKAIEEYDLKDKWRQLKKSKK